MSLSTTTFPHAINLTEDEMRKKLEQMLESDIVLANTPQNIELLAVFAESLCENSPVAKGIVLSVIHSRRVTGDVLSSKMFVGETGSVNETIIKILRNSGYEEAATEIGDPPTILTAELALCGAMEILQKLQPHLAIETSARPEGPGGS